MTSIAATPGTISRGRAPSAVAHGRWWVIRTTMVTVAIASALIALLLVVSVVLGPPPPAMESIQPVPGLGW